VVEHGESCYNRISCGIIIVVKIKKSATVSGEKEVYRVQESENQWVTLSLIFPYLQNGRLQATLQVRVNVRHSLFHFRNKIYHFLFSIIMVFYVAD
jgi:hypothetical protein